MSLTAALLRRLSPSAPLITHYDDAVGSRVELSVATTANWAAKTANWLVDEHDVEPGTPVAVALPPHWQTAGILLGAWWCGAEVVADPADAAVTFVAPGGSAPGIAAAVSLDPMGRDLGGSTADLVDFIGEARSFGDDFLGPTLPGDTPALAGMTVDEVLGAAAGLPEGTRLLTTRPWNLPTGIIEVLLAPLAAGGSLVQVTNPDDTKVDGRRAAEKATAVLL